MTNSNVKFYFHMVNETAIYFVCAKMYFSVIKRLPFSAIKR